MPLFVAFYLQKRFIICENGSDFSFLDFSFIFVFENKINCMLIENPLQINFFQKSNFQSKIQES